MMQEGVNLTLRALVEGDTVDGDEEGRVVDGFSSTRGVADEAAAKRKTSQSQVG